jgi:hypothetical protein
VKNRMQSRKCCSSVLGIQSRLVGKGQIPTIRDVMATTHPAYIEDPPGKPRASGRLHPDGTPILICPTGPLRKIKASA